jgi:hypothetical protein
MLSAPFFLGLWEVFRALSYAPPELTLDAPCERRCLRLSFLPPSLWVPLGQSESHRHVPVYRHHVPLDDCCAARGLAVYPRPDASFAWLPAPLVSSSPWGQGNIGYRHAESIEIGLLHSGQRLREFMDKKFKVLLAPPRWSSLEPSTARQSAVRHGVGWCEALSRCPGRTAEGLRTA